MILAALSLAAQIERMAIDAVAKGPRAGMSIVVVHRGKTLVAKGYGQASVELGVPASADTVYHIDSITKHVTAGAVLRLVQEGKLALDDPVKNYVEALPATWNGVTVRHLLTHTSGSASYTSLPAWGPQERLDVTHDDILGLVRDEPFLFKPGMAWRYNNTGFYLLGLVIEKVTDMSYAEAMRKLVFEPASMTTTQYCGFRPLIRNRAAGYDVQKGTLVNTEPMSWAAPFSGGAICSTASDLVRYERALEEHRLFDDALLQEMRSPTRLPDGVIDYGLGTRLGTLGTHRVVGHTGSGGGFRNVLMRFPEDDLTIVILTNTDRDGVTALAGRIARLVLDEPQKPLQDLPIPSTEIAAYLGRFSSDENNVENVAMSDRIGFRMRAEQRPIPFPYQGNGEFAIGDVVVRFTVIDGKATWAQSYLGGLFADASRRVP